MVQYVVRDALVKYDKMQPIIDFIKNETAIKIISSKINNKRDIIQICYKNSDTLICEAEIEIIGKFGTWKNNSDIGIWEWAWADMSLKATNVHYAKQLLLYGTKLDISEEYYKKFLIMSRGIVKDPVQLDIIVAISQSLIKLPGSIIYPDENSTNNKTTYYLIIPNDDFREFTSIVTKI